MPRYSAGALTTAGSTVLPVISLYSGASVAPVIREISVSNTTSTAVALKLVRLTSQGTPRLRSDRGQARPERRNLCLHRLQHALRNPSLGDDLGYRAQLGAAVGAGWVWVFGADGLRLPTGTATGGVAAGRTKPRLGGPDAIAILAIVYRSIGRVEEAVALLTKAFRLNPMPPDWYFHDLGVATA